SAAGHPGLRRDRSGHRMPPAGSRLGQDHAPPSRSRKAMDTLPLQLLEYRHEGRGRMAAALTLSLAAHAALLAWRFLPATPATQPSTLEVTLVNSRSEHAPLNPQALAQQNLDGGGDRARGMAS